MREWGYCGGQGEALECEVCEGVLGGDGRGSGGRSELARRMGEGIDFFFAALDRVLDRIECRMELKIGFA